MTTPKTKRKKQSKSAKSKENTQRASSLVQKTAKDEQLRTLRTQDRAVSPAKGLLGKHHKWRLTEVGSNVGLGVSDDLETCNGLINYGRCNPFPINVTLVLE